MHFSAFTVSMLVANAAAWGGYWNQGGRHHKVYTQVVTVGAPTFTQIAETPIAETPIAETPIAETPIAETPYEVATTLVTKAYTTPAAAESTAAAASSSSSSSGLTSDQSAALAAHNAARAAVGTDALTWDATLAANAQEWATHLVSVGSLTHSGVSDQGENLYMQYSTDTPFTNAVDAFVSEKSLYNGETITESNYMSFGHYTQVVWKSTSKVGMAMATGSNGEVYVVARYQTPGNYIGETAY